MARSAFTRRPDYPQRDRHFDNAWTWIRYRHNTLDTYPLDMSEDLDSGETADSVTAADRWGVTVDSISVTSGGVISVTISEGDEGFLKAMVTTSAGRILPYPMGWRSPSGNAAHNDRYRY